jgi:diamine N-acetyltransferase
VIDYGIRDGAGRLVTLSEVTDKNWRAVADVIPLDSQRDFVPPSAARYLLLSMREDVWHSLAVLADEQVVGHVMWGWDPDDERYWAGGMLIDAAEQNRGVGRSCLRVLVRWLMETRDGCDAVRLSYDETNAAAARAYAALGFETLDAYEGDEVVAEVSRERAGLG